MISASLIQRYGVRAVWDTTGVVDDLFSGSVNDPHLDALDFGMENKREGEKIDITFAVGPRNDNGYTTLVSQVIVFRDGQGLDRYLRDGITIFDDRR